MSCILYVLICVWSVVIFSFKLTWTTDYFVVVVDVDCVIHWLYVFSPLAIRCSELSVRFNWVSVHALSLSLSLCRYSISLYVYVCAHFFDWLIFSKLTNSIYFLWCLMFMDEWAWFAFSLLLLYFWTCWNDGSSWFCYTLMICICSFGD